MSSFVLCLLCALLLFFVDWSSLFNLTLVSLFPFFLPFPSLSLFSLGISYLFPVTYSRGLLSNLVHSSLRDLSLSSVLWSSVQISDVSYSRELYITLLKVVEKVILYLEFLQVNPNFLSTFFSISDPSLHKQFWEFFLLQVKVVAFESSLILDHHLHQSPWSIIIILDVADATSKAKYNLNLNY